VGRRNFRRGQRIAAWAGPLPLRWADRSIAVHAQGKISARCFFRGNFSATPCHLMFRGKSSAAAPLKKSKRPPHAIHSCRMRCLGFAPGSSQRRPMPFMHLRRNGFSPKTPVSGHDLPPVDARLADAWKMLNALITNNYSQWRNDKGSVQRHRFVLVVKRGALVRQLGPSSPTKSPRPCLVFGRNVHTTRCAHKLAC
jgi:hypothetical protein